MQNPILQMLNAEHQNQNSLIQRIGAAKNLLSGNNPKEVFDKLMICNPQFQKFVKENEKKTIEDIALEYDIDLSIIKKLM